MKQVFLSGKGEIAVLDAPVPGKLSRSVLVQNAFSLISSGTEAAAVTAHHGWRGLYEKALASRDRLEQVWALSQSVGIPKTFEMVRNKLSDLNAIGYSSAGVVVESDVEGFVSGDRVACMGVGFANHAEFITVPINLTARVPDNVALEDAAFGAVACIALHGIRRLELAGGERVGVIGLGLIGQIALRLLDALGYVPFGFDINEERVQAARAIGGVTAIKLGVDDLSSVMDHLDAVVVCAGAKNDEPVNLAFDLCRAGGCVSVVGDVGLGLQREKMYRKELELRISRSYGPGRYDAQYEIDGIDYPASYVRWTEKRNLEYILQLLSAGKLTFAPLRSEVVPVERAEDAYASIKTGSGKRLGVLLGYAARESAATKTLRPARTVNAAARDGVVRIALIGTGSFAKGVHLPNLHRLKNIFSVDAVASRSGGSAAVLGRAAGARIISSDYSAILEDESIDAVLISTRHASHARITLDALRAGKHVFVEKPMAITIEEAVEIERAAESAGRVVRVGFNRRFAPMAKGMRDFIGRTAPRMLSIRVNIGAIANDWSNTDEEGGRLMGEGVHFFDLANWCLGQEPESMNATFGGVISVTNPNCTVILRYPDGSTAEVLYTALGDQRAGKEYYELFGAQKVAQCDDFQSLRTVGGRAASSSNGRHDKGHLACLAEFGAAVRGEESRTGEGANARAGMLATWIAATALRAAREGRSISLDV